MNMVMKMSELCALCSLPKITLVIKLGMKLFGFVRKRLSYNALNSSSFLYFAFHGILTLVLYIYHIAVKLITK